MYELASRLNGLVLSEEREIKCYGNGPTIKSSLLNQCIASYLEMSMAPPMLGFGEQKFLRKLRSLYG
jgi:hypothetical protein